MWPGVEPKRGEYNQTYIDAAKAIVNKYVRANTFVNSAGTSFNRIIIGLVRSMAYTLYWTCIKMCSLGNFVGKVSQTGQWRLAVSEEENDVPRLQILMPSFERCSWLSLASGLTIQNGPHHWLPQQRGRVCDQNHLVIQCTS